MKKKSKGVGRTLGQELDLVDAGIGCVAGLEVKKSRGRLEINLEMPVILSACKNNTGIRPSIIKEK